MAFSAALALAFSAASSNSSLKPPTTFLVHVLAPAGLGHWGLLHGDGVRSDEEIE